MRRGASYAMYQLADKGRLKRRSIQLLMAVGGWAVLTCAASAQIVTDSGNTIPGPPNLIQTDTRNIDLLTATTSPTYKQISVGSGDSLLQRVFTYSWDENRDNFNFSLFGFDYSSWNSSKAYITYINHTTTAYPGTYVETCTNANLQSNSWNGGMPFPLNGQCSSTGVNIIYSNPASPSSSLINRTNSQNYTIIDTDGTQTYYASLYELYGITNTIGVPRATKVTRPSGEILKIYYLNTPYTDSWWGVIQPPIAVVSNYGYMLKYEYAVQACISHQCDPSQAPYDIVLKKITAINLAAEYCNPTATSCTVTKPWAIWTYNTTKEPVPAQNETNSIFSQIDTATDPIGNTTTTGLFKQILPSGRTITRVQPASSFWFARGDEEGAGDATLDSRLYTLGTFSVSNGVETWNYNFDGSTMTVTDALSHTSTSASNGLVVYHNATTNELRQRRVYSSTDANGKVTNYNYDQNFGNLAEIDYPEGNKAKLTYDDRRNLVERREIAKPGSGLADRVWTANFDATCSNLVTCNRPNYVIDPRGNRTDFTYDSTHGGVLTQTGPADASGVRAQVRYAYTSMYAKVLNSSNVLVNADGPIYKLTQTSVCRSATSANPASCVGTANETVTTYAYASNNLLLTSVTVAAGDGSISSTTSYTYDDYGNRVSVDGPRTDVDDVSYITYDMLRRPVYEIGIDPDGSGPRKRTIVHHVYDADSNEIRTEMGTGTSITFSGTVPTNVADFTVASFKRMTYDAAGRLSKTEVVQP